MSIYATLWNAELPCSDGYAFESEELVRVVAQGVPGHIGHISHYPEGDPYVAFLPPALTGEWDGLLRAVVFVDDLTTKGTEQHGQEYVNPVLVLSGEEYDTIRWVDLWDRLTDALEARWRVTVPCNRCVQPLVVSRSPAWTSLCDCGGEARIEPAPTGQEGP